MEDKSGTLGGLGFLVFVLLIAAIIGFSFGSVAFGIIALILAAFFIWTMVHMSKKNKKARQELESWIAEHGGRGSSTLLVAYGGGHPQIEQPGRVLLWRDSNIHLTYRDKTKQIRDAAISPANVTGIRYVDNKIAVQKGGSSGAGTAAAGWVLFGPAGGLVGALAGRSTGKQEIKDTSCIEVALDSSRSIMRLSPTAKGGAEKLYSQLVPLFSPASSPAQLKTT
jgi:hypothetical protein